MNNILFRPGAFICLLATMLLTATSAFAQDGPGRSITVQGVKFGLGLSKSELLSGEPVDVVLEMQGTPDTLPNTNISSRLQFPEGNDLAVFITPPGELEYRVKGGLEVAIYNNTLLDILPGSNFTHRMPLIYDPSQPFGYIFLKPGTYRVRMEWSFSMSRRQDPVEVVVPPFEVTVRAPEGNQAKAFELLKKPEAAKAFQLFLLPTEEIRETFRSVAEEYPKTVYGRECARIFALSATYMKNPDLPQALKLLRQYHDLYPREQGSDLIAFSIVQLYHLMKQYELAREWIFYMTDAYPNSLYLRNSDPLYKYYVLTPAKAAVEGPWYLAEQPWVAQGDQPPTDLQPTGQ